MGSIKTTFTGTPPLVWPQDHALLHLRAASQAEYFLCAGNSDFLLLNLGWINHHIHYGISFHHNRLESFRQCPQWDSQSKFFSKSLGSQNTISKWHYTDFPFLWRTKEIGDNCRQATCTYKFLPNFSWPYCSCQQPAYTCPAIARSNISRYKVSTLN